MEDTVQTDQSAHRRETKRDAIHAAAIDQFTKRGFAKTSMANIADAAGMSRPALYQYFRDKGDIFASAFVALFDERVEAALAALHESGSTVEQLDGFLQRYEGDLWQRMAASPHTSEILSVKNDEVTAAVTAVVARMWDGLTSWLEPTGADTDTRAAWVEIIRLSPMGFKSDQPSVAAYRRRLSALARGVAADIDAATVCLKHQVDRE